MACDEKVMTEQDALEVYEFYQEQLQRSIPDEFERMMSTWDSSFRKESVEHFAQTGWSFCLRSPDDQKLKGALLGQMILFFQGQTQSLWVEDLAFDSIEQKEQLIEIAIRWGRDKHLQKVFFAPRLDVSDSSVFLQFQGEIKNGMGVVKTTKSRN